MYEELYIISNNVELFTTIKGNSKKDTVIVVLHGGPGSGCDPLINNLSFQVLEKDFLAVYFDQRGCGKSTYNLLNNVSIFDLTNDVHNIINYIKNRFNDKKIILWGGSFGGALGFMYLNQYPDEIDKYISSSAAVYFSEEDINNGLTLLLNNYSNKVPESFKNYFSKTPPTSLTLNSLFQSNAAKDFIFSEKCTSKSLKYTCAMTPWFFNQTFGDHLLNLKIPTFIIHGNDDELFDINIIKRGVAKYTNPLISFKEYPNCGHSIFEDKSLDFVYDIKNFINKDGE